MDVVTSWIGERWQDTLIPAAVFLASITVLQWLRRLISKWLSRQAEQTQWLAPDAVAGILRWPSRLWVLVLAAYLGLQASQMAAGWKVLVGRALWSLVILTVVYVLNRVVSHLPHRHIGSLQLPGHVMRTASTAINVLIALVGLLVVMDLWGAPVEPLLLVLALAAIIAVVGLRDILPNLFAFVQINARNHIKVGDYIKLGTALEGYVDEVRWNNTSIRALDGGIASVPNIRLISSTVVNYGRPLKKAKEPFLFFSRTHLKELTGLKARDLPELAALLRQVPESVVYYHTHHFLEEHHYLRPEPPNDFAAWVTDTLGEEALGERLAAVDTFQFSTLGALRERLVSIIEEHIAGATNGRQAPAGQEFHFVKSVSFVTPTPYAAHDLRELVEVLRKLTLGSLYFHIFESRMRLGRTSNDFSLWLADSLGEEQLADEIARLDPYNYTLEELRSLLIQLSEKRVK